MNLKQGTNLQSGRYTILKVLGQGGFGVTYDAVQNGLNRHVAIKEFFMKEYCERDQDTSSVSVPSTGSRDLVNNYKKKFIKEAQTIAQLDHMNIIRIHDIFEENDTAYYVMKFVPNGSLKQLVEAPERMPIEKALGYIKQIGSALTYLHENNIVHLDVKPSNVLLNEQGKAVLIDFGISKHYDRQGFQTSSTPTGVSKGFAPLEQYQGNINSFTPASDIYSLGAVLYNLLTGQIPPEAHIVNEDGLPPFPEDVPEYLYKAVEHAMQPRRKDRPVSVNAWLKELEPAAIEKEPEQAQKQPEQAQKQLKKNKKEGKTNKPSNASSKKPVDNSTKHINPNNDATEFIKPHPKRKSFTKWLIGMLIVILLGFIIWGIMPDSTHKDTKETKDTKDTSGYATALANLYNKETTASGLEQLRTLSRNECGDASFLLSQLFFQSRLSSDVCPDSIKTLKEITNIEANNDSAHQYLLRAVEQSPENYQAAFELAYNYWKAYSRTEAVPQRDGEKAEHYLKQSRQFAAEANDEIYIHKADSVLEKLEIWKENLKYLELTK